MAKATTSTRPVITNSLIKRFRQSILWLYLATLIVSAPVIYLVTRHQVHAEANKELSLLVDLVASLREFISKDVRPGLLEAKLFGSPAISSTVTTTVVARHFKEKRPGYYIKVASDNPLNPKNLSEPLEERFLAKFRADKELKAITEAGEINGRMFLVSARPSVAGKECMLCHGDPQTAPLPVTDKYGTKSGFHYSPDSVVGTIGVGVPLDDVNTLVLQRGLIALGAITAVFGVIFVIIGSLVKQGILAPITAITDAATKLAKGDLQHEIGIAQDGSEIGELANSFELLRRSLKWAMQQGR